MSCSNDQVIDDPRPAGGNDSDMISFMVADDYTRGGSFGNRPGSSTRGAAVTTRDNIYNNTFAVFGDMTSLDSSYDVKNLVIFNGDEVKHDGTQWAYSNPRYWFTNYEYSFVALYPKTFTGLAADLSYENNRLAFSYTLPSDYTQATDILIAGHRRKAATSNVDKKVELGFGHIMSRLNFVAKVEYTGQNSGIEIKSITIKGIASKGTYTALPATISTGYSETSDFAEAAWTISTSEKIAYTKDTSKIPEVDKSFSLFPSTDPLFVIPQEVTGDLVVEITYSVNGKDEDPIEGYLDSALITEWIPGRAYTYSFTIKDNESIIFDAPTVQEWTDYEGGQYIIE
ncbi:MAG: fimbrillin family protein [Muribaculaceae bacterium]|nr:fimbrillin family protein [Muribaculaceae bacterium]